MTASHPSTKKQSHHGRNAVLWFLGGALGWAALGYLTQSIAIAGACVVAGSAGFSYNLGKFVECQ